LVGILIKDLMEEEVGAKVGYYLKVHYSDEAFKTLKFLPIVVVWNLCSKCFESIN
jgi:hypothetical protein